MTEKTAKTTKDIKEAPATQTEGEVTPTLEFPEVLGNQWQPYRENFAVYAAHVTQGFQYEGTEYPDGAWLVRDCDGKDSVVENDAFNSTYLPIPPAKMDTDTQTLLSAVATL